MTTVLPVDPAVEVLVVGAGATGAAAAWRLAGAGREVLCLEQGGWVDPATYPALRPDYELHRLGAWSGNPNVRRLDWDYPVNEDDSPISPLMYNAVGGSTIVWAAHWPRMRPSDFRVRTLDGVADDWPLSYWDLESYLDLNDHIMGVAGLAGDPANPPRSPRPTPPLPIGVQGHTLVRGFEKLGWHWWPADAAILSADYDGRQSCNYCGPCDLGCSRQAKASVDYTYWPKALALGVKLRSNARVRTVTVDDSGNASGVEYYDTEGHLRFQPAGRVVLAANGIGTARLLLNSTSRRFPTGLANSSGLVGRNLMFHPFGSIQGVFAEPVHGTLGPQSCNLISQEFYETDLSRGFVRGYTFQVPRGISPVGLATGGWTGVRVPWGSRHHQSFSERFEHVITISLIGEDLPEAHNRVELDPKLADRHGIPAPKLSYQLSENSRRMMAHAAAHAEEVLRAAGAVDVYGNPQRRNSGWHLMGTARMGTDPATSVVNAAGRVHDVPNLYIVDGSIWVTCGAVNPTSTMQALALFIADKMLDEG